MATVYNSVFLSQEDWAVLTKKVRVKAHECIRDDKGVYRVITLEFRDLEITFFSPTVYKNEK
jgi:hypothetical protein